MHPLTPHPPVVDAHGRKLRLVWDSDSFLGWIVGPQPLLHSAQAHCNRRGLVGLLAVDFQVKMCTVRSILF